MSNIHHHPNTTLTRLTLILTLTDASNSHTCTISTLSRLEDAIWHATITGGPGAQVQEEGGAAFLLSDCDG